jgi:hypothetical protein
MGIDLLWPNSAIQGDHSRQHLCMYFHPMGNGSPWPISAIQGDHSRQHICMSFQTMDIDSLSPFPQLKVTILSSIGACQYIPRYIKHSKVFHHLQMPI